eukprot:14434826-Ditylum_brightwellii.AAC.1
MAEYIAGVDSELVTIKDHAWSNRKLEYVTKGKSGSPFNIDNAKLCIAKIPDAGSISSKSNELMNISKGPAKKQCKRILKPNSLSPLQQEYLYWH